MQFANFVSPRSLTRTLVCICLATMLLQSTRFCVGQQNTEQDAVNRLISIVESGNTGQTEEAHKLFSSLPAESKCLQEASLALTLLYIRESRFSDAWKVLTTASQAPSSASDAVKSVRERLKLWLLLEADAKEKAESQLIKVVKTTLAADSNAPVLAANCSFIGSVAGMIQSGNESPCIPSSTAASALELLLVKLESTNAKSKLNEQHAESRRWGSELVDLVRQFESLGHEVAQQQLSSKQAELEGVRQELNLLRGELKTAGGEKRVIEDQRRKWIQCRKATLQEMARETPGKPQYPVDPGPAPYHPVKPRGHYQIDPKTQVAKYVPPSTSDESRYRDELRVYDERAQKWRVRAANYQRDTIEYPTKIILWEQKDAARRASLNDQKQKAEMGIASAESTMKGMQDEIKQGVAKDLKGVVDQEKKLERLVAMSSVALRYITSKDVKPKSLIRPSSFPILDYEAECMLLKRCLLER